MYAGASTYAAPRLVDKALGAASKLKALSRRRWRDRTAVSLSSCEARIRLGNPVTAAGFLDVAWALQSLVEQLPSGLDWVVDVSGFERLPMAFVSVLRDIEQRLNDRGGRLLVTGLRSQHFADTQFTELLKLVEGEKRETEPATVK